MKKSEVIKKSQEFDRMIEHCKMKKNKYALIFYEPKQQEEKKQHILDDEPKAGINTENKAVLIGIIVITTFNIYQKWQNRDVDIKEYYEKQYARDKMQLENYGIIETEETYEELEERVKLEKYAIENDIKHNILLNLKNDNIEMPKDAQYLLLKVYDYFDIAIILINIYLASTIISEEYNSGTIKNLLVN